MTHFLASEFSEALGDKLKNARSIYYFMSEYDIPYIEERSGTRLYELKTWNERVPERYSIDHNDLVDIAQQKD